MSVGKLLILSSIWGLSHGYTNIYITKILQKLTMFLLYHAGILNLFFSTKIKLNKPGKINYLTIV